MTWILSGVFSVLCVVGVSGLSMAGTADDKQNQAEERAQAANETQEREMRNMEEAAENITETQKERAIEAQRSTQQEAGGIVDQLREGAKGEVNQRSNDINSKIDNLGK
ncbi:hypothetical protein [Candidatus Nitrospira allomarina]|uniref:Uncharacterized protein n=1 Tax=Candidatus Nitrospira allomarina TaxID=3020900 RepID=A0AA96JWK9_9BACT|nr:hypothetical protein [Candidatus Nitrospira allomarina]WNM58021.1 hypothetical protein PP769_18945 [Candidatus Nitrospira allomarina]